MDRKKLSDVERGESFTAEVKIAGINPYVAVPDRLTYLNFLKTPAALERNVQKIIAGLVAK